MEHLSNIIDSFHNKHVLVIGDLILDKYLFGKVERISPESPVPIVNIKNTEYRLGGAANVANNIVSLGGKCTLIGQVGKDEERRILEDEIRIKKIDYYFIEDKNYQTIKKTRVVSQNQQMMRIDWETQRLINESEVEKVISFVKKIDFDIIVISDYNKGMITKSLMDRLKRMNKKILVDPKPVNINIFKGVYAITPNMKEAKDISKKENVDDILKETSRITDSNVILTRGEEGASLYEKDTKNHLYLPSEAKEVFDVSGAGDTFISTIALSLASGASLYESVNLGNFASGIVVGKLGTSTISSEELKRVFRYQESKIKTLEEMKEKIKDLKRQKKKIVFTNGCFDIIHVGHTKILREAKSFGDVLILGLNTDKSIKRLKGPTRPINNEEDRAEVLANLESVDYITFFDEDTPIKLIKEIIPDVLVKGSDYRENEVVGNEIVKKNGGVVRLIRLVEGKSTTSIINKTRGIV